MKTAIIYEQPECLITEFEAQSVLCQSGATGQFYSNNPFGDSEEAEW